MASSTATTTTTTTTTTVPAQQPQQPAAEQSQQASAAAGPSTGSPTASGEQAGIDSQPHERLVLRLRPRRKKGVRWTSDTVDNEDMGKKKSKKCCIFHKQRRFGEWSDSDSSDEDGDGRSGSDSDGGCEHCRPTAPPSGEPRQAV